MKLSTILCQKQAVCESVKKKKTHISLSTNFIQVDI